MSRVAGAGLCLVQGWLWLPSGDPASILCSQVELGHGKHCPGDPLFKTGLVFLNVVRIPSHKPGWYQTLVVGTGMKEKNHRVPSLQGISGGSQ